MRAVEPQYPEAAMEAGATGTVYIEVTLDDSGALTGTSVWKSSGNLALDDSARNAALRSTYASGTFACRPHGGSYLFDAVFTSP